MGINVEKKNVFFKIIIKKKKMEEERKNGGKGKLHRTAKVQCRGRGL